MANKKSSTVTAPRCDNCCFSTFATGSGRPVLICRQKKDAVGRWSLCKPPDSCPNFYPSRAARTQNKKPRLIPLTRNRFAVVDAEDYPRLSRFTWFAEGRANKLYAVRKQNGKSIKMHRQILNAPDQLVVDHINHNGIDNRKSNLRLATFAQNCRNLSSRRRKSSRYKGVHWHKETGKWAAAITADRKTHHLGYFQNETDAAKAYDKAAKKYHKNFANPNFPG